MNIKKIVTLLLAGLLAVSFVLPVVAQTPTEGSQQVAAGEAMVSSEESGQQNREASPNDEDSVNHNEDQAVQSAPQGTGVEASEGNGQ